MSGAGVQVRMGGAGVCMRAVGVGCMHGVDVGCMYVSVSGAGAHAWCWCRCVVLGAGVLACMVLVLGAGVDELRGRRGRVSVFALSVWTILTVHVESSFPKYFS